MIFNIKGTIKIKSKNTSVEETTQRIHDGLIKNHARILSYKPDEIKWIGSWLTWFSWQYSTHHLAGKEGVISVKTSPPDEIHIEYNMSLLLLNIPWIIMGAIILIIYFTQHYHVKYIPFILFAFIIICVINALYYKMLHRGLLTRFIHDIKDNNV